jgi:DNA-binding NarL/FixJ family response regulator
MAAIQILVLGDQPIFRQALCDALQTYPELLLVGHGDSRRRAELTQVAVYPDVVILHITMLTGDKALYLSEVRSQWPAARIVLMLGFDSPAARRQGLEAGVDACCAQDFSPDSLVTQIYELLGRGHDARANLHASAPQALHHHE